MTCKLSTLAVRVDANCREMGARGRLQLQEFAGQLYKTYIRKRVSKSERSTRRDRPMRALLMYTRSRAHCTTRLDHTGHLRASQKLSQQSLCLVVSATELEWHHHWAALVCEEALAFASWRLNNSFLFRFSPTSPASSVPNWLDLMSLQRACGKVEYFR